MAEGMLGGILGEEVDKPEVEAPEALASADAFAAAVAAKLAGNDPGVARKTEISKDELQRNHRNRWSGFAVGGLSAILLVIGAIVGIRQGVWRTAA